jgi:hypothetical protein
MNSLIGNFHIPMEFSVNAASSVFICSPWRGDSSLSVQQSTPSFLESNEQPILSCIYVSAILFFWLGIIPLGLPNK